MCMLSMPMAGREGPQDAPFHGMTEWSSLGQQLWGLWIRKEFLMSSPTAHSLPLSPFLLLLVSSKWVSSPRHIFLGMQAHSVTGKAAFGSLSSHTGSCAGQRVCTGHPYRVHGICPPLPGLVFQFWAPAKAPQLEMAKEKEQVLDLLFL